MASDRPMLVCVSDVHLTDSLHGSSIPKAEVFERFWVRIQAARGARPAILCFVGDLFDIVRSPTWLEGGRRPYHDPSADTLGVVERIVDGIIAREERFFSAIRSRVQAGELEVRYVLGNHDRLLAHSAPARRAIWRALTGEETTRELPTEMVFPEHGVLAAHGNAGDPINDSPEGAATIGDAVASELIVRFPRTVQGVLGHAREELEDIDDVRPIYAVPAWVRQLGIEHRELLRPIARSWGGLVEEFLYNPFVQDWMKRQHKTFGLDTGTKLKLLLELSTGKVMAHTHDQRLTKLYRLFQQAFDGKMAQRAARQVVRRESEGVRYVVNGHSHFASMVPLGSIAGAPAVYFNTGTWRTLHQIGHDLGGRPSFLAFDAMSYLVFFPTGDPMGRDYEWWTGACVARERSAPATLT